MLLALTCGLVTMSVWEFKRGLCIEVWGMLFLKIMKVGLARLGDNILKG